MHSVALNGGVVSPVILFVLLVGITAFMMIGYKLLDVKTRIHKTWSCGYTTSAKTQYSATGFAGPIRRFFEWLYKPKEHIYKEKFANHETKFYDATYEVHVAPLFETSLYNSAKKLTYIFSHWIYKLAHFEKTRYSAMIFNLMLLVLFSYRTFAYQFSWATFALESIVMMISIKVLIIGDKK